MLQKRARVFVAGVVGFWPDSTLRGRGAGEGERGSGEFSERGGEFFADAGNESAVGVDDEHGEAALANDAERPALCVERERGDLAQAELAGGFLHGIEHAGGCGAHGDEVEPLGDIVGGDDQIAVREDTGTNAWERAAEFDHAADGEFFLGEKKGLERVLVGKVRGVAAGLGFEKEGLSFRGRESVEGWKTLDEFDEAVRLVRSGCGIGLGSGFGSGWLLDGWFDLNLDGSWGGLFPN